MTKNIIAILTLLTGLAAPLPAEIMTYQGRLKDNSLPANGNYSFAFEFCDVTGTACTPSADLSQDFLVSNGLFKSTFTMPSVDLAAQAWYLRVSVGGSPLTPMERLTAVPYAVYASSAGYSPAAVQKTGSVMTGQLTLAGSTLTVTGAAFSVGGGVFNVENGKVGISTVNPAALLEIVGNPGTPHLLLSNPTSDVTLALRYSGGPIRRALGTPYYDDRVVLTNKNAPFPANADAAVSVWDSGETRLQMGTGGYLSILAGTASEKARFTPAGNLGLGTSAPAYRLVVSSGAGENGNMVVVSTGASDVIRLTGGGEVYATRFIGDGSGITGVTGAVGVDASKLPLAGGTLTGNLLVHNSTVSVTGGEFSVSSASLSGGAEVAILTDLAGGHIRTQNGHLLHFGVNGSDNMVLSGGGLGLNYAGPLYRLHVGGAAAVTGQAIVGGTMTVQGSAFSVGESTFVVNGGRVGVGEDSLAASSTPFHVAGTGAVASFRRYTASSNGANILLQKSRGSVIGSNLIVQDGDTLGQISFQGSNGDGVYPNSAAIVASVDGAVSGPSDIPGRLSFWTSADGAATVVEKMRLDNQGRLGINTTAPLSTLHVVGDVTASGSVTAQSTLTVAGSAFSVGGSTLAVDAGKVGIGAPPGSATLTIGGNAGNEIEIPSVGTNVQILATGTPGQFQIGGGGTFEVNVAGSNRLVVDGNGNVGIDFASPAARLDLKAVGSGDTDMVQIWRNSAGTVISSVSATGSLQALRFVGDGSGLTNVAADTAVDASKVAKVGDTMTGPLVIHNPSALPAFQVGLSTFVVQDGLVGINTSSPLSALHVGAGNIRLPLSQSILWDSAGDSIYADGAGFAVYQASKVRLNVGSTGGYTTVGAGDVDGVVIDTTSALHVVANGLPTGDGRAAVFGDLRSNGSASGQYLTSGNFEASVEGADNAEIAAALRGKLRRANGSGGVVNNAYGLLIDDLDNQAGTISKTYGIYIGDQTSGTQTDPAYSLYASDTNARSYFAGAVGIGNNAPAHALDITGDLNVAAGNIRSSGGYCLNGDCISSWSSAGAWRRDGVVVSPAVPGNNVLIQSTLTVAGNAFSVDGFALIVKGGMVGVGASSPGYALDVSGTIRAATPAGGNGRMLLGDGDVAHGMTGLNVTSDTFGLLTANSPNGGLHLAGYSDSPSQTGLYLSGVIGNETPSAGIPAVRLAGSKRNGLNAQALASDDTLLEVVNYSGPGLLTVRGSGRVGISTGSPTEALDVANRVMISTAAGGNPSTDGLLSYGTNGMKFQSNGGTYMSAAYGGGHVAVGSSVDSGAGDAKLQVKGSLAVGAGITGQAADGVVVQGRVGVGTAAPSGLLEVRDITAVNRYLLVLGTGSADSFFTVSTSGVVGIGYGTPSTNTVLHAQAVATSFSAGEDTMAGLLGSVRAVGTGSNDIAVGGDFRAEADGSQNLAYLAGLHTEVGRTSAGAGVVDTAVGLYVDKPENYTFPGGFTNTYGVYIDTQTSGNQTNAPYALYSIDKGARAFFAGKVGIGTDSPRYALEVSSAAGSAEQILAVSTGTDANNVLFGVKGNGEVYGAYFIGNGAGLTNVSATDASKLPLAGGTLGGPLTVNSSSITVNSTAANPFMILNSDNNYGVLEFRKNTSSLIGHMGFANSGVIFAPAITESMALTGYNGLHLGVGSDPLITMTAAKKVGVGVIISPQYSLDVSTANDTDLYIARFGANGILVSTGGAIQTTGFGNGTFAGDPRGNGAVELQTARAATNQVASGVWSTIGGGRNNRAYSDYATVAGGQNNTASWGASVGGGTSNAATLTGAVVGGGSANSANGMLSTIAGGSGNRVGWEYGAIGGGYYNLVTGSNSVVAGGRYNIVHATSAVVAGGENNSAPGMYAALLGGNYNRALGAYSAVVGGYDNQAAGHTSFLGAGYGNRANGLRSVVPGGYKSSAVGDYSFAGGKQSSSTVAGAFTWSDSKNAIDTVFTENSVPERAWFKMSGGFLVSGSTNTNLTGQLDRGVLITGDGLVGVATGVPYAALDVVSTGTAANQFAQIWRESGGVIKGSMSATGVMMAASFIGNGSGLTGLPGDNLGNHAATKMVTAGYGIQVSTVEVTGNAFSVGGSTLVATNGRIGIGKLPATDTILDIGYLQASGESQVALYNSASKYGKLRMRVDPAFDILTGSPDTPIRLSPGGSTLITLKPGAVGINTVLPDSLLHVDGGSVTISGVLAAFPYVLKAGDNGLIISTGGAITTTGTGNGSVVGNLRGNGAVDLQTNRDVGGQVASGPYSVIGGGLRNSATYHAATVAGGQSNSASYYYSTVGGGNTNTAGGHTSVVAGGASNAASGIYSAVGGGDTNKALAAVSAVGGGNYNVVSGSNSVVAGGAYNTLRSTSSVIAGGEGNSTGGDALWAAIAGGSGNQAIGVASFVGGGRSNTANYGYAAIGGGMSNATGVSADYAFLGGGYSNQVNGVHAALGGGWYNIANGMESFIGAGGYNTADPQYSVIVGGLENKIRADAYAGFIGGGAHNISTAPYSVVGGGLFNTSSGTYSGVLAGSRNEAIGVASFVGGGSGNTARGDNSTVGGGSGNLAFDPGTVVAGGISNVANEVYSFVGGGYQNEARTGYTTIAGGYQNIIGTVGGDGAHSFIGGGYGNETQIDLTVIAGGEGNYIANAGRYGVIGGGFNNRLLSDRSAILGGEANLSTATYGTVGGGLSNTSSGTYAAVLGGYSNEAAAIGAAVVGGENNYAGGIYSFVGGGRANSAPGLFSAVGGGEGNTTDWGQYAAIGGGKNNYAYGYYSAIPGGADNYAGGQYSLAAGRKSTTTLAAGGSFAWNDNYGDSLINQLPNTVMFKASGGFWVSTGTIYSTPGLMVNNNNDVGMGTAAPAKDLHIKRQFAVPDIRLERGFGGETWDIGGNTGTNFNISQGGTNNLTVEGGSGKVGIAHSPTTNSSRLQVNGDLGLGDGTKTGNQPVVVWLQNNFAGTVSSGSIVAVSAPGAFTTTSVAGAGNAIGVVYEPGGIANGAVGRVAITGMVRVRCNGTAAIGNHVTTSGINGEAASAPAPTSGTSIGVWMEACTSPAMGWVVLR